MCIIKVGEQLNITSGGRISVGTKYAISVLTKPRLIPCNTQETVRTEHLLKVVKQTRKTQKKTQLSLQRNRAMLHTILKQCITYKLTQIRNNVMLLYYLFTEVYTWLYIGVNGYK